MNGRLAKLGDQIVGRDCGDNAVAGILARINPGTDTCNGRVVPMSAVESAPYVTLKACLHVDDVLTNLTSANGCYDPRACAVRNIARVCHEANRAYCAMLGDHSQPPWDEAPKWQIDSAVNGVAFHLENPQAGPEHSHKSWMAEKQAAGWKFGPVKDAEKKEHPCMVPYEQLSLDQRVKDSLFIAIIHALLPMVPMVPVPVSGIGPANTL